MTAVENVSAAFMAQERKNSLPVSENQVAKKSTAKASKYLSNLPQKPANSSPSSGPALVEGNSVGNGSIVVNGNGNVSDNDSDKLLDSGDESMMAKGDLLVIENGQNSVSESNHIGGDPELGENDDCAPEESLASSLADSIEDLSGDCNQVQDSTVDNDDSNSSSGIVQSASSEKDNSKRLEPNESETSAQVSSEDIGDKQKDSAQAEEENRIETELLSDSKIEDHSDTEIDDSILDDPETEAKSTKQDSEKPCEKNEDKSEANIGIEDEIKDVENNDDELKTDNVLIKHDIEMTDDCDKDTKPSVNTRSSDVSSQDSAKLKIDPPSQDSAKLKIDPPSQDSAKLKIDPESVDKSVKSSGVKRSLSQENGNTEPKRSKLEDMIGRLSSSVGKKPEEVENMENEEEEEGAESDSSSESESSADTEKLVTLSTKDLNRIIRKRIDVILRAEKGKMQRKIEELQLNVDMWKTQAKELRMQLSEASSKASKEKKRPSLKRRRRPPRVDVGVDTSDIPKTVQAAQHQQGPNTGVKSSPRTPTAPTLGRPGASNTLPQNAINVRNAQVRPAGNTVKTLLEQQRGVGGVTATAGAVSRNVRPTNVKNNAKQLGGCIDLTDDDEKGPPTAKQQTVRTMVQTTQLVSPVVQAPAGLGGSAVFLQGSSSGPLVLQPVTQGMRLAQQGNVVYASGTPIVRPGVVPQLKPGQQILVQTSQRAAATTVSRPPPPLKSAPGLQKHPAPLPPTPSSAGTYPKHPPPKPSLKISRVQQGIVLSWNMTLAKDHADITNYQLFAYQETSASPSTNLWKKVGDVKALPLPMACTLTQFQEGNKYHFAVRAIDTHNRMGSFSEACSIHLSRSS